MNKVLGRKYRLIKTLLLAYLVIQNQPVAGQTYEQLHREAIVVDAHNDVLIATMRGYNITRDLRGITHSDINRFKLGGVDIQVFSVWCDENYGKGKAFKYANRQMDSLAALIARNPDRMMLVRNPAELTIAVQQHKLGAMMAIEGGHMLENKLANLDSLYKRGARYLTLTWNNSTPWATSAQDEVTGAVPLARQGLSTFGQQLIRRMNQLGMLVDLSHAGEKTFWDALQTTTKPVLVSHSSVYRLCRHYRNLKDDQIKAIAKNGGVIQLNFNAAFIDPGFAGRYKKFRQQHHPEISRLKKQKLSNQQIAFRLANQYPQELNKIRPPLSKLLDHLDYIVKLVGVDYVGLGSDFDGVNVTPLELDSVAGFPAITKGLVARGYSTNDINKILGGNFIRVFSANAE